MNEFWLTLIGLLVLHEVLIDWIGSLKLADFGLGRHFQMPMRMYTHEVGARRVDDSCQKRKHSRHV